MIGLLLCACGGGNHPADVGPAQTPGQISGTLNIIGPLKTNTELYVGLVADGQDEVLREQLAGKVTSADSASTGERSLYFLFTDLPIDAYHVVVFSYYNESRLLYYRGDAVQLNADQPDHAPLSVDFSLTGPEPWGTVSGLLLLNGINDRYTDLVLYVKRDDLGSFRYKFGVWTAGYGALYYAIGGLAVGEYSLGIMEPTSYSGLGMLDGTVSITADQLNLGDVTLTGDFINIPPEGEGFYISGFVILSDVPKDDQHIALLAVTKDNEHLDLAPICHILPENLNEEFATNFTLGWLSEGEYTLMLYALDFAEGHHILLNEPDPAISVSSEYPINTGYIVRGDLSLIP